MDASTKLEKAGRAFLLRLVAEYGPEEAARILRDLADEIEGLADPEAIFTAEGARMIDHAGGTKWGNSSSR